ncbi:uncharacterized protein MONOS_17256 [Monocercomonoides exilis]|uniref:uncharacterized protein n=1 Tax=Monocercomonoides exilis TaxID=2049356 RepID=UPI00355A0EDD|nr:hypothetical protein MONOS_17256 [Monocercomonoides exilis]
MIIEEEKKKKKKKNEKLLIDLCECHISLSHYVSPELRSICITYLTKAASKKGESEETQKEVEMALLILSSIRDLGEEEQDMYIFGIDVIILYHQQHHNLTPLAHQSAWKILVHRFYMDYYSEEEIVNDLHFVGEAAKELKELAKV